MTFIPSPSTPRGYASPGYVSGRYYTGMLYSVTGSTGVLTADRLYITPFQIGAAKTFTKLGMKVTANGDGCSFRLGVYNVANGVPTSLLVDAGQVTLGAGVSGEQEITVNLNLGNSSTNYALAALINDSNTTVIQYDQVGSTGGICNSWFGGSAGDTMLTFGAYTAQAYGALPATWPGALTYITGGTIPALWVRE